MHTSLELPGRRAFQNLPGSWSDYERLLDTAASLRSDDGAARAHDNAARRGLPWACLPAPLSLLARPIIFRAVFREDRDAGGAVVASDSWFDQDYTATDPISAKLASIVDYIDPTHALTAALSANQCAIPAGDAAMGNALTASFVGTELYISNRATGWSYTCDGSGFYINHVFVPTQTANSILFGTRSPGAPKGIWCFSNHGIGAATVEMSTGAAALLSSSITGNTVGTATWIRAQYKEGAGSPEWRTFRKGTQFATGDSGTAPVAGEPGLPFRIGDTSNGSFPSRQRHRATYLLRRVPVAADATVIDAWITAQTLVTA